MQSLPDKPSVILSNEDDAIKVLQFCLKKKDLLGFNAPHLYCYVNPFQQEKQMDAYGNKLKILPDLTYIPENGTYAFQYKQRNFWITYHRSEQVYLTGQARKIDSKKTIKIECQGDCTDPIKEFIKEAIAGFGQSHPDDMLIYENAGGSWIKSKNKRCRTLDSVILDRQISEKVMEDLREFIDSDEWYKKMGVPYRRSYLLYGPPGTGKSSFAQAIAGHMKFSICFINVSDNMTDYNFNHLLNTAPLKAIILLEDVDAMFEGRKNKEHANKLTYSGFLNSLDGVRSQQGRILIMTTNHKERLDPALLRPGRTDAMFELSLSSKSQIERLFIRFFKDEELAKRFSSLVPQKTFSMSQLQGFFVKYKKNPKLIVENVRQLLDTEENVRIEDWLESINCQEASNSLKLQNVFSLAALKNLPNESIEKYLTARLSKQKLVRLIEALRNDSFVVEKDPSALENYVNSQIADKQIADSLLEDIKKQKLPSLFHVRDQAIVREKQKIADEHRKKSKKDKKKKDQTDKKEKSEDEEDDEEKN